MRNILLSSLLILAAALPAAANISGTWKIHPSLDIYSAAITSNNTSRSTNNVAYMAEGERFNHMLIAGWLYNSSSDSQFINTPHYTPARLDKAAANPAVRPLAYDFNLSGTDVEALDYALHADYAVVAYSNSAIDIIHDDGRFLSNLDLTRADLPGTSTPNAISFSKDEKTFFVSLPFGFLEIDPESGETLNLVNLKKNVDFANRVGNYYVLSIDGELNILDASLKNRTRLTCNHSATPRCSACCRQPKAMWLALIRSFPTPTAASFTSVRQPPAPSVFRSTASGSPRHRPTIAPGAS